MVSGRGGGGCINLRDFIGVGPEHSPVVMHATDAKPAA